jgi:hypothetical protein
MPKKITPRLDSYAVIMRAVEEGIAFGLHRAFKHDDEAITPDNINERLSDLLRNEVSCALCDVVDFDRT